MATATMTTPPALYSEAHRASPPGDHIQALRATSPPDIPTEPNFGLDSLFGLVSSAVFAPLYLYSTLRGKFSVWDDTLASVPDAVFRGPTLDVGCGRGMVLLKMAARKKLIAASDTASDTAAAVAPAYGIDIFSTADQTGNSPLATYKNAAAMRVTDYAVLHTASFTEAFPFADGAFSLVTSNLAIHNAQQRGRIAAVEEMARVCAPDGRIILIDLYGYFKDHRRTLEELGWTDVHVSMVGMRMMFGVLPCQVLTARKPKA